MKQNNKKNFLIKITDLETGEIDEREVDAIIASFHETNSNKTTEIAYFRTSGIVIKNCAARAAELVVKTMNLLNEEMRGKCDETRNS